MNPELYNALKNGDIKALQKLIEIGINLLDKTERYGDNVLSIAASYGHTDTVAFLLKQGAYIDLPLKDGNTPYESIVRRPSTMAAISLLEAASKLILIDQKTLNSDSILTIEHYIRTLGQNLNARRYKDGNTTLHIAIQNSYRSDYQFRTWEIENQKAYRETVEILLEKGASLDITNHDNKTPFQMALNPENPYMIAVGYFAKARKLSLELEQVQKDKSSKSSLLIERKEKEEARDIKTIQEELSFIFNSILIEASKDQPMEDRNFIYLKLGEMLSKPESPTFDPVKAYEVLSQVKKDSVDFIQFNKANAIMFQLLMGGHVILQRNALSETDIIPTLPDSGLESTEDDDSYCLRLRAEIKHLMLSKSEDRKILGKLIAEYAFGFEHSIKGIEGITGKDIESQLVLMDTMRKVTLENKKLKEELEGSKKQKEELIAAKLEIAELRKQLEAEKMKARTSTEILTQYRSGGPLAIELPKDIATSKPKVELLGV